MSSSCPALPILYSDDQINIVPKSLRFGVVCYIIGNRYIYLGVFSILAPNKLFCLLEVFFLLLHQVFVAACRLSLVVARGATLRCGARASHCGGFSCCGAQALGTRASVVAAHRLSCSAARGIFPDQGLNPCPLHWQADS